MEKYRKEFTQYFPTIVEYLTERGLFDSSLKHNSEHLKEVIIKLASYHAPPSSSVISPALLNLAV